MPKIQGCVPKKIRPVASDEDRRMLRDEYVSVASIDEPGCKLVYSTFQDHDRHQSKQSRLPLAHVLLLFPVFLSVNLFPHSTTPITFVCHRSCP